MFFYQIKTTPKKRQATLKECLPQSTRQIEAVGTKIRKLQPDQSQSEVVHVILDDDAEETVGPKVKSRARSAGPAIRATRAEIPECAPGPSGGSWISVPQVNSRIIKILYIKIILNLVYVYIYMWPVFLHLEG